MFGFPSKLQANGNAQIIPGFVSCFNCFKTLPYHGSTKYMHRHKCLDLSVRGGEKNIKQTSIDKYVGRKTVIEKHDKEKFRDLFPLWKMMVLLI